MITATTAATVTTATTATTATTGAATTSNYVSNFSFDVEVMVVI